MHRLHGLPPYQTAFFHGGPGGLSSGRLPASELADRAGCGVIELIEHAYSLDSLTGESCSELDSCADAPLVLIGHSFGALLAALTARELGKKVRKVILVSCCPLVPGFPVDLEREKRFSPAEREEFSRLGALLAAPDGEKAFSRLGALCEKADTFSPRKNPPDEIAECDKEIFFRVWPETAALRESGGLLKAFLSLECELCVIHGDFDSHPAAGVSGVLKKYGKSFSEHLLPRCGHTPWKEEYAWEKFYSILQAELS